MFGSTRSVPSLVFEQVQLIDLGEATPIDALIEDVRRAVEQCQDGRAPQLLSHETEEPPETPTPVRPV